jgi:predicted MFS family arabinose efflux permease
VSRDFLFIALAMFTWGMGEGMYINFQPIYLSELGASPTQIGGIISAFGLTMMFAHIPAGYLSDRIGRKPLLVVAWALGIVGAGVQALATTLPLLIAGILLYGFTAFVSSPLSSYITAARGRFSVGRALTFISAGYNLGAMIGAGLGGRIGEVWGLRYNYFVACAIFVLSTLLIFFTGPQPIEKSVAQDNGNGWVFNPRFLFFLGIVFLATFAMLLPQTLTSKFLQEERALSLDKIGGLYALSSVGVVILSLALGQLPVRWGFVMAQLAVGIFTVSIWRGNGLFWYSAGLFLMGGFRTARSFAMAQVRSMVHGAKMGLAYGLTETVAASAVVLAPLLAGYLYTQNPVWMYVFGASGIGFSILVSALRPSDASHSMV